MQKSPIYLKAITLRKNSDICTIKDEAKKGMILILRVTPLAQKDIEELRRGTCGSDATKCKDLA